MERVNHIKLLPKCDEKFVEELLNLLGEPRIEVYFRSEKSDEEIRKIASLVEIREARVKEVKLLGIVSKEIALKFYKQSLGFQIRDPLIILEKMEWVKLDEYSICFDCYSLKAKFYSKSELSKKIFELSQKYKVACHIEY